MAQIAQISQAFQSVSHPFGKAAKMRLPNDSDLQVADDESLVLQSSAAIGVICG
jgi:hypothetical protein